MKIIIVLGNHDEKIWKKRVERGVEFYNSTKNLEEDDSCILIFSGTPDNSVLMRNYAIKELKVNEKKCLLENNSKNTFENLLFSKNLLEKSSYFKPTWMGGYDFVICTSKFHIPRSTLIALDVLGNYGKIFSIFPKDEDVDKETYEREKEFTYQYITNIILEKTIIN